jgi:hypothetical protein
LIKKFSSFMSHYCVRRSLCCRCSFSEAGLVQADKDFR